MKIQIDTERKTIKVAEAFNLREFIKFMQKLFPNGEWQDYKMDVPNDWTPYPIIIERPVIIEKKPYQSPWVQPYTGSRINQTSPY